MKSLKMWNLLYLFLLSDDLFYVELLHQAIYSIKENLFPKWSTIIELIKKSHNSQRINFYLAPKETNLPQKKWQQKNPDIKILIALCMNLEEYVPE